MAASMGSMSVVVSRNVFQSLRRGAIRGSCCRLLSQDANSNTTDSSSGDTQDTEYMTKLQILRSSLPFVHQHGWTNTALAAGAEVEGFPGIAHGLFLRGGVELIFYFYNDCNKQLAELLTEQVKREKVEGAEKTISKIQPFISGAIQTRLRMLIPFIEKWPQAMGIMALPQNAPEALSNLVNLTDEIWHHAGDSSTDFNWYTKRVTLGAMYKATEVFMVQDKSEDYHETWQFLDRRMADLNKVANIAKKSQQSGTVLTEACKGFFIMARNIVGTNARAK